MRRGDDSEGRYAGGGRCGRAGAPEDSKQARLIVRRRTARRWRGLRHLSVEQAADLSSELTSAIRRAECQLFPDRAEHRRVGAVLTDERRQLIERSVEVQASHRLSEGERGLQRHRTCSVYPPRPRGASARARRPRDRCRPARPASTRDARTSCRVGTRDRAPALPSSPSRARSAAAAGSPPVVERATQVVRGFPHGPACVGGRVPLRRAVPRDGAGAPCRAPRRRSLPRRGRLLEVFLAFASVFASPNGPSANPYWSNQVTAQRVSASISPSCSASVSASTWLMRARAVRTRIGVPSALQHAGVAGEDGHAGPIAAWARSTGAMLPCCKARSAAGSSRWSSARNWRRVADGASARRGRQTRTMDEARAFVPTRDHDWRQLRSHRPRAVNDEARAEQPCQHRFPSRGRYRLSRPAVVHVRPRRFRTA